MKIHCFKTFIILHKVEKIGITYNMNNISLMLIQHNMSDLSKSYLIRKGHSTFFL